MKTIIPTLALIFVSSFNLALGCSCYSISFCEYVNSQESFLALRGKVIEHSFYETGGSRGFGEQAIYIEVQNKYKDDIGVGDTIKLYGSSDGFSCAVNLVDWYPVGSTIICAFGEHNYNSSIKNPDSLTENYWEWFPDGCYFPNLTVVDGQVMGTITHDIWKYPLYEFERNIYRCNYSYEEVLDFSCSDVNVYPNPTPDGQVIIESSYFSNSISNIAIYSIDGKIVNSSVDYDIIDMDKVEIRGLKKGINIIHLTVDEETCMHYVLSH